MKVIYLHQYFRTPDQSGGTRSYEMARRLVQRGHDVHVVTSCMEPTGKAGCVREVIEGITVHWLPVEYSNKMGFLSRLLAFFHFAVRASIYAAKLNGSVVFATSTPLTIAIPGVYAAKIARCPLVFEVRDLWPTVPIAMGVLKNPILIWLAKQLERFAYRNSKHIVALSDEMAKGVVASGVASNCVTVIPNSADLELFDPNRIESNVFRKKHTEIPNGPIVLYPGTLGKVNGVDYLVRVAKQVEIYNGNIVFVLIGDGVDRDNIESLARSLGVLGVNLFMLSAIPKRDLVYAFKDASLVISTVIDIKALEANSANKIFDGMAAGKAVAINHGGWQKDLILECKLGLALPREVEAAAMSLIEFFREEGRALECGANARAVAVERFSRDSLARKLEGVLESASNNRGL